MNKAMKRWWIHRKIFDKCNLDYGIFAMHPYENIWGKMPTISMSAPMCNTKTVSVVGASLKK